MKSFKSFFASDYGMLGALFVLCLFFSVVTYEEQQSLGGEGVERLAELIHEREFIDKTVLIAGTKSANGKDFVDHMEKLLESEGWEVCGKVSGAPPEISKVIREAFAGETKVSLFACDPAVAKLPLLDNLKNSNPEIASMEVVFPETYWWPNFLKASNLLNVANQIAVIAIIAIGMTMVIITAGIDLSVGSLIAFSAVFSTWLIRECFGGLQRTRFQCSVPVPLRWPHVLDWVSFPVQ